jgi:hypothetical protein
MVFLPVRRSSLPNLVKTRFRALAHCRKVGEGRALIYPKKQSCTSTAFKPIRTRRSTLCEQRKRPQPGARRSWCARSCSSPLRRWPANLSLAMRMWSRSKLGVNRRDNKGGEIGRKSKVSHDQKRQPIPMQMTIIFQIGREREPLELENLVVVAVGVDGLVELRQKFAAIAGQKVDAANAALLQALVGIESVAENPGFAPHEFAFL